jgi:Fe-S-cluster containining protein
MAKKSVTQPLSARPGARFACAGDGLCCTDIHGLGPLTSREARAVRKLDVAGAGYDDDFEELMLCTAADGGCHFLLEDLRCSIHAERGPEAKPSGCRQFPFIVTATPGGGRVSTHHRCPCRTLGRRPPLTPEAALPSIADKTGRPVANFAVGEIRLGKGKVATFEEWLELERPLLARLNRGEVSTATFGVSPFPKLKRGATWRSVADSLIASKDGTRFGAAAAWYGDTIRHLVYGERPRTPHRPWADAFDRAERRGRAASPRRVYADWIADELWSLRWAESITFARFKTEITTRLAIAENIGERLEASGVRADRAAAEAVCIIETVSESDHWSEVVELMKLATAAPALEALAAE